MCRMADRRKRGVAYIRTLVPTQKAPNQSSTGPDDPTVEPNEGVAEPMEFHKATS